MTTSHLAVKELSTSCSQHSALNRMLVCCLRYSWRRNDTSVAADPRSCLAQRLQRQWAAEDSSPTGDAGPLPQRRVPNEIPQTHQKSKLSVQEAEQAAAHALAWRIHKIFAHWQAKTTILAVTCQI